ncbi:hypothetical protein AVEN_262833-1 [Araneus ventricosus]|uniref:Uncharacterized protein n=1 Tax=Araneus ventricosus TaxID=182803 RepID=A0A4Y2QJH5_ARAVE|nr:hypothetical protein AVEN_262833-1 [Araneus ventricosus]
MVTYHSCNSILPTWWQQFGEDPFLSPHNRAPVHKALAVKNWFVDKDAEELECPTEHLLDELERHIRARPQRLTSVTELTSYFLREWCAIRAEKFQKHVDSLPHRAAAIIKTKGGLSSYYFSMHLRIGKT